MKTITFLGHFGLCTIDDVKPDEWWLSPAQPGNFVVGVGSGDGGGWVLEDVYLQKQRTKFKHEDVGSRCLVVGVY